MKVNMRTLVISLKKIRTKYICCWLRDQLSRPEWFRNFFITRNAWGAFSINSHIRGMDKKEKVVYPSREVALKAAEAMSKKHSVHFSIYKCLYCSGWHVGRNKENKEKTSNRIKEMKSPLDFPEIRQLLEAEEFTLSEANACLFELCERGIGFKRIENNCYQYKDFLIQVGKQWTFDKYALIDLSEYHLSFVPHFVAHSKAKSIDAMLITEIPGLEVSYPVPCFNNDMYLKEEFIKGLPIRDVPREVRMKLYDELVMFMNEQKMCLEVTTNRDAFTRAIFYVSSSQNLIFSDCRWLRICGSIDILKQNLRLWLEL